MGKKLIEMLEAHLEKGILGVGVLFMAYMLWAYILGSPNTVDFNGKKLQPRELSSTIAQAAKGLDSAIKGQKADPPVVEKFSERLTSSFSEGIFAREDRPDAPPLPAELRLASTIGGEVAVPGLENFEQEARSIALVTPLRPTGLKLRTGRSLVIRKPVELAGADTPPPPAPDADAKPDKPEEVAWVSLAGYFDKKAQYAEMAKKKYAPYRSKSYIVGMEVEREEMLADGSYSDWKAVKSGAMPKLDIRDPVFDPDTGDLINKEELDREFTIVKQEQTTLMQPPFFEVVEGTDWEIPPIAGFDTEDEPEEDTKDIKKEKKPEPPKPGPLPGGRGGRFTEGGGRFGGGGGELGGRGPGNITPVGNTAREKAAARRAVREQLKEAKTAMRNKDWNAARQLAERVLNDQNKTKANERDANELIKRADKQIERERGGESQRFGRGPTGEIAPIRNPETRAPAVWYHDDTVEAGKTYRYRGRVKLWNRYVGRTRAMINADDAKKAVIAGDWSVESEPITVTPSTYFYLASVKPGGASARLEVWKWREGAWIKQSFEVGIGEVIGEVKTVKTDDYDEAGRTVRAEVDFSTGAILLDIREDAPIMQRVAGKAGTFKYSPKKSTVIVYLDPADGQVKERVQIFDRYDPIRAQLDDAAG